MKRRIEKNQDEKGEVVKKMNLIYLLLKWKKKLNQRYLKLLESLNKNYLKLQKYQKENLECILSGKRAISF